MEIDLLHNETFEDLNKFGVYLIINKITNEVYVGSTNKSFISRWKKHLISMKVFKHHSYKLNNSVKKYGLINFLFVIIDLTEKEHTTSIEKYWMNMLDSINIGFNVSNSVNGGCLGYKFSDEYKLLKSKMMIGNSFRLNIKHSEEIKTQIKKSTKEFYQKDNEYVNKLKASKRDNMIIMNKTVFNKLNKKPVLQIDMITNEVIKEWDSASDVGRAIGKSPTSISKVCRGKSKYAYGFIWRFK